MYMDVSVNSVDTTTQFIDEIKIGLVIGIVTGIAIPVIRKMKNMYDEKNAVGASAGRQRARKL